MFGAKWQSIGWGVAVAAGALLAVALRDGAVDPPSLWLDDQWVALVIRDATWSEFFALKPPIPVGFFAAERLFSHLSADPEWPLQVLPLLAAAGQVVFAALLGRQLTGRRSLGALAAALTIVDPLQVLFGPRVKQYSTDALATLALLWVGLPLLEKWSFKRALALSATGLICVLVSFPAVFGAAPLLSLALLAGWVRREPAARSAKAIALVVGFDAAIALIELGLVRGQNNPTLEQYWVNQFMPSGAAEAAKFFALQGWSATGSLLPGPLAPLLLLLLPAGLFALALEPRQRFVAIFCAGFALEMMLAAALHLYPLGGGRTDAYAHPVMLVPLLAAVNWRPAPAWVLSASAALLLVFARPSTYPECSDAEVVARARSLAQPGDGLLIYPHAGFATAYYGGWPVQLVRWPEFANGFQTVISREDTVTLPARDDYWHHPERLDPVLSEFAQRPYRRIFYLVGGWPQEAPHQFILSRLTEAGWKITSQYPHGSSSLLVLEKRSPQL